MADNGYGGRPLSPLDVRFSIGLIAAFAGEFLWHRLLQVSARPNRVIISEPRALRPHHALWQLAGFLTKSTPSAVQDHLLGMGHG